MMLRPSSILFFAFSLIGIREISSQCARGPVSNCIIYDGTQVSTFDGTLYSFTSSCGYTLLSAPASNLEVNYLKNTNSLEVKYEGRTYLVSISANGVVTFTRDGDKFNMPQTLNGVTVSKPGRMVIVEIKALGIKIRYDGNTAEVIQNNNKNFMQTNGVCGNNDGCSDNDLVMKNGQMTTSSIDWANSWVIGSCVSAAFTNACGTNARLKAQAQIYCNNLFGMSQFNGCSAYSSLFMDVCTSNYCGCKLLNRNDCMCDMLDSIVRMCQTKNNNIISWRTSTLCPIQCVNPDQSYSTCAPDRKQLSCGEEDITNPGQYDCEEGCYCPSGMRLYDGQCLFKNECPCIYEGTAYPPGSSIAQDCNTCVCTNGNFVCTTDPCECDATCIADPHYTTFDGRKYDFMGKCQYYIVRGIGFDVICDHYVLNAQGNFIKNFQSTAPSFCAKVIVITEGVTIELLQNHVVHVNGRQISTVPRTVSGIRITRPSSEFTAVVLRNKVTVRYNGLWTAGVSIPTSMKNRVHGLFGTFNRDPADDFTSPTGIVMANANDFGHTWKVPGSCSNDFIGDVPHPCDTNPAKRASVEQACSVINGSLFAGCSNDPIADYDSCVYDGCYCPDNDPKCFCEHFARQGEQCAAKGINVDWRATITQCAITCPAGQTYQTCGNSCTRSCADISATPGCFSRCVDGCNCPAGQTLDNNNQCVQIAQCPCVYNNVLFPAGFTFIDIQNGNKHVCENALWTVTTATVQDIQNYPSLDDFQRQCSAADFLVYSGCKRTNTLTCLNKHLEEDPNYNNCQAGCECVEGFVFDTEMAMCVRPEDCPCMYKGISYPDNAVINNRNEICTCVLGFWECTPQTDHWEKCSAWGDVHVRTFDETVYSFEGNCEYILFEHVFGTGTFRVTLETSSCNTGSCIAALYVHHRAQNGHVDNIICLTGGTACSATPNLQNLVVTNLSPSIMIDVVGLGVRVIWNTGGWAHVHVSPIWLTWESFGLCGKYDNNPANDLEVTGVILTGVADFVNYHKLDQMCEGCTIPTVVDMLLGDDPCNYLQSNVFRTCRYLVDVNRYFDTCIMNSQQQLELPAEQRTNHYCEPISAYAQECADAGAPVNWRTNEICPLVCPVNKVYHSCDMPCPLETCQNTGTSCPDKVCAEACNTPTCPSGQVYLDATYTVCVDKVSCPPTAGLLLLGYSSSGV